mmetsp:Transcript_7194/g.12942  ORF Transcript_7194/g.12942 Transcript_7194/m.12942 type:complete len:225 (+) Transcript_7194:1276-1950(+)
MERQEGPPPKRRGLVRQQLRVRQRPKAEPLGRDDHEPSVPAPATSRGEEVNARQPPHRPPPPLLQAPRRRRGRPSEVLHSPNPHPPLLLRRARPHPSLPHHPRLPPLPPLLQAPAPRLRPPLHLPPLLRPIQPNNRQRGRPKTRPSLRNRNPLHVMQRPPTLLGKMRQPSLPFPQLRFLHVSAMQPLRRYARKEHLPLPVLQRMQERERSRNRLQALHEVQRLR